MRAGSAEILDRVINKVVESSDPLFSFHVLNSSISICHDYVEVTDSVASESTLDFKLFSIVDFQCRCVGMVVSNKVLLFSGLWFDNNVLYTHTQNT